MKLILFSGLFTGLAGCQHVASKLLQEDSAAASTSSIPTTASRVYGQLGSFSSNFANNGGVTANSLNSPTGVAVDATGVFIADFSNNRVLFFSGTSTTASRVYGQLGSFTSNTAGNGGTTADSLNSSFAVSSDGNGLYISDTGFSRVLYYAGASTTASRVYGQGGVFTTAVVNNGGISSNSLNQPTAAIAYGGDLYVADYNNHRALFFSGASTTASRVYGQGGNYATNAANNGGVSATSLNQPAILLPTSSGTYIVEFSNHRVLYFDGVSTTASRVYGQNGSFTSNTANNGGITANSLNNPGSICVIGSGVFIVDKGNNRVLYYEGTSTTATKVWGQGGSFTTATVNYGGLSAEGLNGPNSVFYYNGNLYIADRNNNRVLMY